MADIDTKPAIDYTVLVEFSWGNTPTVARYARWEDDIVTGGDTFTSHPELDVEIPEQQGGFDEEAAKITTRTTISPLDELVTGHPHAPVTVTIYQYNVTDDAAVILFKGKISRVTKNPSGRPSLVRVEAINVKSQVKGVSLGISANTTCSWRFGDAQCQFNVAGEQVTATVDAGSGGTMTLQTSGHSPGSPDFSDARWRRGYVELDGNRIMIRESTGSGDFKLATTIPPSWEGETVTLVPGCDKNISTCRDVWDNEEHFGGFGIAIPARNPLIEV